MVELIKARRLIYAASVTIAVKNYPGECAGVIALNKRDLISKTAIQLALEATECFNP